MPNQQKSGKTRKTTKRLLNARARRLRALELKTIGKTFQEIADELGYADRSGAQRAVTEILASEKAEAVEDGRKIWNARLEAIWAAHGPLATKKTKPSYRHARIAIAAANTAIRMNGYEAPVKTEHSGLVGTFDPAKLTDEQIDRALAAGDIRAAFLAPAGEGAPPKDRGEGS